MNVIYGEGTRRTPEEARLLEQATAIVEGMLGLLTDKVQADWSRGEDSAGRPLFVLRLSAWKRDSILVFSEDDLRDSDRMWKPVNVTWRRMLRERDEELGLELQAAG